MRIRVDDGVYKAKSAEIMSDGKSVRIELCDGRIQELHFESVISANVFLQKLLEKGYAYGED